jgi:hypothetical protein
MSKSITSRLIVSLLDGVAGPAAKSWAALTALQKQASVAVAAHDAGIPPRGRRRLRIPGQPI